MRLLKTAEAAEFLQVSPNTLRSWERRFGYPRPQRTAGRHRLYPVGELRTLRAALDEGLPISSAVARAEQAPGADAETVVAALEAFDAPGADRAMAAALELGTVDGAVEGTLMPALDAVHRDGGPGSAAWAFGARWGVEWLARMRRLAPAPSRPIAVLIGDATTGERDTDAAAVRAFELACVRAGASVLALSTRAPEGVGAAAAGIDPDVVVLAGSAAGAATVRTWLTAVRPGAAEATLLTFRRPASRREDPPARTAAALPDGPAAAADRLVAVAAEGRRDPVRTARVLPFAPRDADGARA